MLRHSNDRERKQDSARILHVFGVDDQGCAAMADMLARNRWQWVLCGVAVMFAILAFTWPGLTAQALVLLFATHDLLVSTHRSVLVAPPKTVLGWFAFGDAFRRRNGYVLARAGDHSQRGRYALNHSGSVTPWLGIGVNGPRAAA